MKDRDAAVPHDHERVRCLNVKLNQLDEAVEKLQADPETLSRRWAALLRLILRCQQILKGRSERELGATAPGALFLNGTAADLKVGFSACSDFELWIRSAAAASFVRGSRQDPYRMLACAGWRLVDAYARRAGIATDDVRRLVGGVEAALSSGLDRGDTGVTEALLAKDVATLLGCDRQQAARALSAATAMGAAKPFAGGLQASGAFVMERFMETEVRVRSAAAPTDIDPMWMSTFLDGFELAERLRIGNAAYSLSTEQRQAVGTALRSAFGLLVGGPGVGKRTALRAVVEATRARGSTVLMAALSGRAARRMEEATGSEATTLAALLLSADRGDLRRLEGDVLLVVDESSMVDLLTAYRLLRRLPGPTRILLVGDPGQLPPIGPASVLV